MIRNLQLHHFFKSLKGLEFFGVNLEELSDNYKDNDFSPLETIVRLCEEFAYGKGFIEQNLVSGDPDVIIDCSYEKGVIYISMDASTGFLSLNDVNSDPSLEPMSEKEYERYFKLDVDNVLDELSGVKRAIKGRARQIANASNLRLDSVDTSWDTYGGYAVIFSLDILLTNLD